MAMSTVATSSSVWIRISELKLALEEAQHPLELLHKRVRGLGVPAEAAAQLVVVQRALDARKRPPLFSFSVAVPVAPGLAQRLIGSRNAAAYAPSLAERWRFTTPPDGPRPVVVGAGPAGLFAALVLAEAGWRPILLERGKAVEERSKDVSKLYGQGVLDPDSNVCFGEGGAGTYSDGKLYTRVGDPRVDRVLQRLVEHGAPPRIQVDNRPHVGTDKLVLVLERLRAHLESLGTTYRFGCALEDLELEGGAVKGLRLRGGERLEARVVVLATGHSAREVWERLDAQGLPLECRPFAMGYRVEHPQALIDEARYGRASARGVLPAADYKLTHNTTDGRGVYSFCMCPGGVVVATPTHAGELCINGMSHAARSGRFANSALVVSVGPADYAAAGYTGTFAGVDLQLEVERKAYAAGGGAFVAPAARLADFAAGRVSSSLAATSYRRGIVPAALDELYPAPLVQALRDALPRFERSIPGFLTADATLIGVETRTASPIRVPRGDDLQALGARGLYPAGEGMGYGGGIVSAAVDGMRVAEAALRAHGALVESLGPIFPQVGA